MRSTEFDKSAAWLSDSGSHLPSSSPRKAKKKARRFEAVDSKLRLVVSAYNRVLKVGRIIAVLAGTEEIQPAHIAEAIQYRWLDRRL